MHKLQIPAFITDCIWLLVCVYACAHVCAYVRSIRINRVFPLHLLSRDLLLRALYSLNPCVCVCVCSSTCIINSAIVLNMCHRLFLLPCVVNYNILPSPSSFTSIMNSSLPCHKMLSVRFPLISHSAGLKPTELVWFVYSVFFWVFLSCKLRMLVNIN